MVSGTDPVEPKPKPMLPLFFAGLDLGQAADFSALAILERLPAKTTPTEWRPAYTLRHIERYPLGTAYPAIVDDVLAKLRQPTVRGCSLTVDATGCGAPVLDLFRRAGTPRGVYITGGNVETYNEDRDCWNVAKRILASTLQALLQTRRLKMPLGLPNRKILEAELSAFRVKLSATGQEQFESWRERDHDDLVLAVCMAAWSGEQALTLQHTALTARPQPRRLVPAGRSPRGD